MIILNYVFISLCIESYKKYVFYISGHQLIPADSLICWLVFQGYIKFFLILHFDYTLYVSALRNNFQRRHPTP